MVWECFITIFDDSKWLGVSPSKSSAKHLAAQVYFLFLFLFFFLFINHLIY